jgi:hypothetical protein
VRRPDVIAASASIASSSFGERAIGILEIGWPPC